MEWTGEGYGVHADAGFRLALAPQWGLSYGVRYRYSDGTAFTDEEGLIPLEFTGVDFLVRLDVVPWGT